MVDARAAVPKQGGKDKHLVMSAEIFPVLESLRKDNF